LFIPSTLGAALLALGVLVNVFNEKATRIAKRWQSYSFFGATTVRWVTPIFVRVMGVYIGVFGLVFLITGVTSMFQS
jgi:multisubunit Na+/H+ antiporter MnhB subunit